MRLQPAFSRLLAIGLAGWLLAACAPGSDGQTCTLIGCEDGTTVRMLPPAGHAFPDGQYEVTTAAGNFTFVVTGGVVNQLSCTPGGNSAGEISCFLSGSPPSSVPVIVKRDSTEVLSMTASSAVKPLYPNGESCGAVCTQGTVTVQLP